jgi:hypothetical protein
VKTEAADPQAQKGRPRFRAGFLKVWRKDEAEILALRISALEERAPDVADGGEHDVR